MADKSPVDPKTYTTDYIRSDYAEMTFMGDSHVDAMASAIQALGAELWTNRRRLYTIEALMERKIPVTNASIQAYLPTAEEDARWKAERDAMIGGIYSPFLRGGDIAVPSKKLHEYNPHTEPAKARRAPRTIE